MSALFINEGVVFGQVKADGLKAQKGIGRVFTFQSHNPKHVIRGESVDEEREIVSVGFGQGCLA